MVPQMLTNDQKKTRLNISRYLPSRYEDDPGNFIERVVIQDQTGSDFDPESKIQSKQWLHAGSNPPETIKSVHLSGKGDDINLLG